MHVSYFVQELKGNIRVFARVRPPSEAEMGSEANSGQGMATDFPSSGKHGGIFVQLSKQQIPCAVADSNTGCTAVEIVPTSASTAYGTVVCTYSLSCTPLHPQAYHLCSDCWSCCR